MAESDGYLISTTGRYCYFYKQAYKGYRNNLVQIDLFDLTPKEIKNVMKERMYADYETIAFGYVRNKCKKEYDYTFPDYLKTIVWKYFADKLSFALTIYR